MRYHFRVYGQRCRRRVDYLTFDSTVGVELANGKGFSFGVNYNLQLSEHRIGHGLYGVFRIEF